MMQDSAPPISLRRLILTRVSALVATTTLLVAAGFVWFGLLPMAEQIAQDQFHTATTLVEVALGSVFAPASQLLDMSRGGLGGQTPCLESPTAFNRLFQPMLEGSAQLTSVVAGSSTGQGWLLLHQSDCSWPNRMTDIANSVSYTHL